MLQVEGFFNRPASECGALMKAKEEGRWTCWMGDQMPNPQNMQRLNFTLHIYETQASVTHTLGNRNLGQSFWLLPEKEKNDGVQRGIRKDNN